MVDLGARGILYGSGYLGIALVTYLVGTWVTYAYAPPVGRGFEPLLPVGLVGVAMAIGRVVDAVTDPLVGLWSDAARTPWGRRRPFIIAGAPLLALSFWLLWIAPAAWSDAVTFVYLAGMLSLFFLFFTVVVAPYLALLPEIAADRRQRLSLAGWQAVFNVAGVVVAALAAGPLIAARGFAGMGMVMALVALLSLWAPAAAVRERPGDAQPPLAWREALRETLANPAFRPYLAGQVCFWFALSVAMSATPYIVTVLMGRGEAETSLVLGAAMGVALATVPLTMRWAAARGAKRALSGAMLVFAGVLGLLGLVGRLPLPGGGFVQGIVLVALAGFPLGALFVLPNALVADITDLDERRTGRRREAVYFGVQGLVVKVAQGLASLAVGVLLGGYGYGPGDDWGIRLLGPVAGAAAALGVWVFRGYPEDPQGDAGVP